MKHLLSLLVLCSAAYAEVGTVREPLKFGYELVAGTTRVIWVKHQTVPEPGTPVQRAVWINLHSEDRDVSTFHVTLVYKNSAGRQVVLRRSIANNPWTPGSFGYWVSNPNECLFWIDWPTELAFSVTEEKKPTELITLEP